MLASLKSCDADPASQSCCISSGKLTAMASPPILRISAEIPSVPGAVPIQSCCFLGFLQCRGIIKVFEDQTLRHVWDCLLVYLGWSVQRLTEMASQHFSLIVVE